MKTCSTCSLEKSVEDFHKKSSTLDGLEYDCKNCAEEKELKLLKDETKKL